MEFLVHIEVNWPPDGDEQLKHLADRRGAESSRFRDAAAPECTPEGGGHRHDYVRILNRRLYTTATADSVDSVSSAAPAQARRVRHVSE